MQPDWPTPSDLAGRIERAIDPVHCNYGPSLDSVPCVIVNLKASEWRQVINALRTPRSERPLSREAVIEEVAKHIEGATLTYFGPDPGGVKDLKYLIVAEIRGMKGKP